MKSNTVLEEFMSEDEPDIEELELDDLKANTILQSLLDKDNSESYISIEELEIPDGTISADFSYSDYIDTKKVKKHGGILKRIPSEKEIEFSGGRC